jgi:glucose-1-phosphate thymidylyltransferase
MLAGIKDILIISTPTDTPGFEQLWGDGVSSVFSFLLCPAEPGRFTPGFILGEEFIGTMLVQWCWRQHIQRKRL